MEFVLLETVIKISWSLQFTLMNKQPSPISNLWHTENKHSCSECAEKINTDTMMYSVCYTISKQM